jgi:hypothetical protein
MRQANERAHKNHGREVFDVTKLQPYYEAAISLCTFVAANGGMDFGKWQPEIYRWEGAPTALLAQCALVLFVSNRDMNAAIAAFAKLLSAPEPSDLAQRHRTQPLSRVRRVAPRYRVRRGRRQEPERTGLQWPAHRHRGCTARAASAGRIISPRVGSEPSQPTEPLRRLVLSRQARTTPAVSSRRVPASDPQCNTASDQANDPVKTLAIYT